MRAGLLVGVSILVASLTSCPEIVSATSRAPCGDRMRALKAAYEPLSEAAVAQGVAGMARAAAGHDPSLDPDSYYARRQQQRFESAARDHLHNVRLMERARRAYEAARAAGCWYVPPPPYEGDLFRGA